MSVEVTTQTMQRRTDTGAFRTVVATSVLFFVLTLGAMIVYPGGRVGDVNSRGYSFFANFFSDLGQTRTHSGDENTTSLVLFCSALALTAIGLIIFFVAFARLFGTGFGAVLSRAGAVCGIGTGVAFIGVACTPWNLYLQAHNGFVMWAFRSFLLAVILDAVAVTVTAHFPRRFAIVFGAFAVLLAGYVALLTLGPRVNTERGARIQATGQKIIVYASVLTLLIQSLDVERMQRDKRR